MRQNDYRDKIVPLERLLPLLAQPRASGEKVVFTNGCFDLIHTGHTRYLQEARRLGDILVVGLNSDASVRAIKGPRRPVRGQDQRAEILAALGCVDHVTLFDEETPARLVAAVRPDVLVKGGDWPVEGIVGADFVRARGGRVWLAA